MRSRVILAALVLAGTSGCVSGYRPPAGGPQATVVAKTLRLYLYSNERCDNASKVQAPIFKDENPVVKIAADRPAFVGSAFDTRGIAAGTGFGMEALCIATGSFTPVADATYEVKFHLEGGSCRLEVRRVNADGGLTLEPSYRPFAGTRRCIDNLF